MLPYTSNAYTYTMYTLPITNPKKLKRNCKAIEGFLIKLCWNKILRFTIVVCRFKVFVMLIAFGLIIVKQFVFDKRTKVKMTMVTDCYTFTKRILLFNILFKAIHYSTCACPKVFERSQKLDPGFGWLTDELKCSS